MSQSVMRMIRILAMALIGVAAPLTMTSAGELKMNECDAQGVGTCCELQGAVCENPGPTDYINYCYRATGTCQTGGNPCREPD
jgi:hypothetical protein